MAAPRYITRSARRYGIDPKAALAVAMTEGGLRNRKGDIGDLAGGGSFGPFQLYSQGALPSHIRAKGSAFADRWAWSPQGIDYAIRKMKEAGAGGLKGRAAIEAIVRKFERPADPDSQVAKAWANYMGGSVRVPKGGGKMRGFGNEAAHDVFQQGGTGRSALLAAVMQQNAVFAGGGVVDPSQMTMALLMARRADSFGSGGLKSDGPIPGGGVPGGSIPGKGWQGGKHAMIESMRKAQKMGLAVRENPMFDKVDPVHTEGSYHYQNFGKGVGRAADISGDPAKMAAFYKWAQRRFGKRIAELFHDPLGGIKHGKQIGAIGGHGKHVHIAF